MNGEIFRVYLQRCLVPTLKPGDIVVMDNLSAHKNDNVRQIIEAAGAILLYLPPYKMALVQRLGSHGITAGKIGLRA